MNELYTELFTRCTVEEQDLCFACYRREHLQGDDACWHIWKPSTARTCKICDVRDAAVVCVDCNNAADGGMALCDNCWTRTHAHLSVETHRSYRVEQLMTGNRVGDEELLMLEEDISREDETRLTMAHEQENSSVDCDGVVAVFGEVEYAGAEEFGHDPHYKNHS